MSGAAAARRFVITHIGRDRPWAEWVAARLADASDADIVLTTWRWDAGEVLSAAIASALRPGGAADRVVVLFSEGLLEAHEYLGDRWPSTGPDLVLLGRVVPVRIEPVRLPEPWGGIPGPALFQLGPVEAAARLVTAVVGAGAASAADGELARAGTAIVAPRPRLPGHRPDVWNVPARDDVFVGRDEPLTVLREELLATGRVAIEGRYGMGGVGKTRLALEYVHRFGSDYDLVWWTAAERPSLIGDQLAALALRLGLVGAETDIGTAATVARSYLRRQHNWLLVFDNAEAVEALAPLLPGGGGHVIVTSRTSGWGPVATPLEVDLLSRAESVLLLRRRHPELSMVEAGRLAAVLGDLPLAIVLAVGYLAESESNPGDFLTELAQHVAEVLDEHRSVNYPHALAGAIATTAGWLANRDPVALAAARISAFLAPRAVPVGLLTLVDPEQPTGPTRRGDTHPLAALDGMAEGNALLHRSLVRLQRLGLVQMERPGQLGLAPGDPLDGGALTMHRLTAAILRDHLGQERRDVVKAHVDALLAAATPVGPNDVGQWRRWRVLLPHLFAADPAHSDHPGLRASAVVAGETLLSRGDVRTARDLVDQLHRRWLDRLGPDHPDTMAATRSLAQALRALGRFDAAHQLDADLLDRRRRVLGEDHSESLAAAADLADDAYALGDHRTACDLDEDVLVRRRRVFGDDHPSSLSSALRLARDLAALGDTQRAAELRSWVDSRAAAAELSPDSDTDRPAFRRPAG